MGILDILNVGPGILGSLLGGQQRPRPQQYPWMPPQQQPGFFDHLANKRYEMAGYLAGALQPGTTMEQISRGLAGMTAGAQTDILNAQRTDALNAQRMATAARAGVADKLPVSDAMKLLFASDPKVVEQFTGQLFNQPTTTLPDGTVVMRDPFGNMREVYRAPPQFAWQKERLPDGREVTVPRQLPATGPTGVLTGPHAAPRPAVPQQPGTPGPQPQAPGQPMSIAPGGFVSGLSPQTEEEMKGSGKILSERYDTIIKGAASATASLPIMQRMRQLNLDPNLPQGVLAPFLQQLRSSLTSLGVDTAGKVAPGELFQALHTKLTLDAMPNGSLGAQISNTDRDFVAATNPGMANTKEGRQLLIDMQEKFLQRRQDVASLAFDYKKRNGTLDGFDTHLAKWAIENPLFPNAPAKAPGIVTMPKVGEVREGYTYVGGDPAKQESWKKVQ